MNIYVEGGNLILISLKNISKSYNKGKVKAVDDLSLDVNSGELFGFLGPNGAGKTTTIKMMTGLLKPDKGSITINKHNIILEDLMAKKQFGYLPENIELYENLSGIQYLNFMADIYDVDIEQRQQRSLELAEMLNMKDVLADSISSYSQGMKRKIAIIGTLLHNPKIWILDEPLSGLDPKSSYNIKNLMKKHTEEGNTVFFSTHVMEIAENICDRIGIINQGKLIALDNIDKIKKDKTLENVFLELTENE